MALPQDLVAAVDLGGTNVRAAVVDARGALAGFVSNPTEADRGPAHVIRRVLHTLDASLAAASHRLSDMRAIGVGAPGPLDWRTGVVHRSPNLPGWRNVPLAALLRDATERPVYVDNDANGAALAEFAYGANAGVDNMAYITVSTGVGGGLILNGELWHGVYGSAGEIGHMTVDYNGPQCGCGNVGDVEAIASGPHLAAWVAAQIRAGRETSLADRLDETGALSGRDVVEAARDGDELATQALQRAGRAVGFAVVNLTHVLNLELAIVGGGIARAGELLLDPIRRTVERYALPGTASDLRVEPWSLHEDVGLLGAAAAARQRIARASGD